MILIIENHNPLKVSRTNKVSKAEDTRLKHKIREQLRFEPLAWEPPYATGAASKSKKKIKK